MLLIYASSLRSCVPIGEWKPSRGRSTFLSNRRVLAVRPLADGSAPVCETLTPLFLLIPRFLISFLVFVARLWSLRRASWPWCGSGPKVCLLSSLHLWIPCQESSLRMRIVSIRDVSNELPTKLRSWFGPNGQYIRELPCPSCRGRGYTPCAMCGIERSRLDCPQCNGKVLCVNN